MTDSLQQARIDVVRRHMALECVQDWDGVIDTFEHPRYEMHGSGAVYDGQESVMAYFESSRATFPDLANEVISIAADGNSVLVEFWLQGTHLGTLEARGQRYEPTGRKFRVRMAASFEFAAGTAKIICERPYTSVDAKLIALKLM
jgi:limonene-1,2-epoxide hydrolase